MKLVKTSTMPRRRLTDKVRELADMAWARGNKDLATELHSVARKAEAERENERIKPQESTKA